MFCHVLPSRAETASKSLPAHAPARAATAPPADHFFPTGVVRLAADRRPKAGTTVYYLKEILQPGSILLTRSTRP
jgi:hypothetical protein